MLLVETLKARLVPDVSEEEKVPVGEVGVISRVAVLSEVSTVRVVVEGLAVASAEEVSAEMGWKAKAEIARRRIQEMIPASLVRF